MDYNIFSKLETNIQDFDNKYITVASIEPTEGLVRYATTKMPGYRFSQRQTLNIIDLYYNSKFESGEIDSEGTRKVFLNIVKFNADVAAKQTDLDVKNFIFVPDSYDVRWKTWFMSKEFQLWARKKGYGKLINELNRDYSKYGSCVAKRVNKNIVRVPLRTLKNTQSAKTLWDAVISGGYVIESHEYSEYELKEFAKVWNIQGIEFDEEIEKCKVYEMYNLCPKYVIDAYNGIESDDESLVPCMSILCPKKIRKNQSSKTMGGSVLFIEEIKKDDFPYEEAHYDKQDGRWLGIGEVENQFENQIARNITTNLRRRSMMWGSKKIFQSSDDMVNKNLVKNVKDGEVLRVGPNGAVTQVNTSTQSLADYAQDEAVWEKNTQQKSFAFEVSTGESLPSGTPFRLGVVLSNAVESHFKLKQENLGFFFKEIFNNQLVPIFKKEHKENVLAIGTSEGSFLPVREMLTENLAFKMQKNALLSGQLIMEGVDYKGLAAQLLSKESSVFFQIPKGLYDDVQSYMELEITGESQDTPAQVETLTTLYTTMAQNGDPRADRILALILSKTGKNLDALVPQVQPTAQTAVQSIQNATTA